MESIEFSFDDDGGGLRALLRKVGLGCKKRLVLRLRILVLILMTWFPLLILSASHGLAVGQKVRVPFLYDLVQHARFLVALPIAIWAEGFIGPKFESVLNRFLKANLVSGEEVPRFLAAIARAKSLKRSVWVEPVVIALAYLYIYLGFERNLRAGFTTWNQDLVANLWYRWLSMPIFISVWMRWVWRQGVWATLLFRISRLKLRLVGTHPDHAGGLTFVSVGQRRFAALVFALSSIGCASIGEEMLFTGASLRSFEMEIVAFFVVCVFAVMGPLLTFSLPMIRAKLKDSGRYGILAADYTQQFDDKWINKSTRETLLGSPDIQSLADMMNSYEGIAQMRTILPDRRSIIVLLIAYALPMLPLLSTIIPLKEITSVLLKFLIG